MTWSDRGGASRIFGDMWSEHCWTFLSNGADIFRGSRYDHSSATIVRLDDNPKIAVQAGRHKLPNPDFLLLHPEPDGSHSVRAVDAKFAVDRLRRTQICPDSIRDLVELSGSLARQEVERYIGECGVSRVSYEPGLFLGPRSLLNDYFYERATAGDSPDIPVDELHLVSVHAGSLFERVEDHSLMQLMQSIDGLRAATPESELVLGMYYLRLASAARWFETQARLPLLSREPIDPPSVSEIYQVAEKRIEAGESAFGLIETWSHSTEQTIDRQKQVQDAAQLPLRMTEIRKRLEQRGLGAEKRLVRKARGILEQEFMHRLLDQTGTIPAQAEHPLNVVVERVSELSRSLRPEMLIAADRVVEAVANEVTEARTDRQA